MKEKHHFAADVDADYYMANSGYGVSNYEKQSQFVSIRHKHNCESIKKDDVYLQKSVVYTTYECKS